MDLWVIAATAATGYIANYLQNISKGNERFPESSSEDFSNVKPKSPRCLVSRLMRGRKTYEESFGVKRAIANGKNVDLWERDSTYEMEVPFTSGESSGNNKDVNSHSVSSLMPELPGNGHEDCTSNDFPTGDMQMYSYHNSSRTRTFLRNKRKYRRLIKPLSSLESCLVAQFHNEQMTMEDYMLSPFPSTFASMTRPLLVTDGTRVISRNGGDSFSWQIQNEDKSAHVCGICPLPELKSPVASNKMRFRDGKSMSRRRVHANRGSYDAAVLLCIGIFIGITSSIIAGKKEVDKLKQELKQTENLVQDLQDELEMKDSLTVKELENENMETQKNRDLDYKDDDRRQCDKEAGKNSESMSRIEAELEAELERLEININTTKTENRLSDVIEMEPDFTADFVQGDLRVDKIKGPSFDQTESNQDPSGKSTPDSGHYVVSPRELSMRLHKVINSRLEGRIKELEIALQESERKVELLMESERKRNPWTKPWENHEVTNNNPVETQPLVMNLAGDALEAYNEAYEGLMKVNDDSEEDDSPSETHQNRLNEHDEESFMYEGAPLDYDHYMNDSSRTAGGDVNFVRVQELPDVVGLSDEEEEVNSEFEEEMERRLIKQIVEKTKQGSPVVLNAQKMFLMEDRERNL